MNRPEYLQPIKIALIAFLLLLAFTSTAAAADKKVLFIIDGKSTGAVCDPRAFDGVVIVEPGILGPIHGTVAVDLVEPGCAQMPQHPDTHRTDVFQRGDRPSVMITIGR